MKKVSKDNIGRFQIAKEVLAESEMDVLLEVFKDIFVLKVVQDPLTSTMLYVAVSPMFREVETGTVIPLYDMTVAEEQLKTKTKYHVSVKEVEEEDHGNWIYM